MARVLVVEDDAVLAMLVEDWLVELGYAVAGPANNVEGALALVEREGAALGAGLVDVSLGKDNSYPIAAALRRRGVPFAFVTGHDARELAADFRDAPTLTKPFSCEDLTQILARLTAGS
jgi:CheY-like chemotaxis protein